MKKIAIIGGEGSGKTTLVKALANKTGGLFVPEFVRLYQENRKAAGLILKESDIKAEEAESIALGQLALEKAFEAQSSVPYLFFDTTFRMSFLYGKHIYNLEMSELDKASAERKYDLCLLLAPDLPWEADPQRQNPEARERFFNIFRNDLVMRNIHFKEVRGTGVERLKAAMYCLENL